MFDGFKRLAQKVDDYIEEQKERDLEKLKAKVEKAKKDEVRLDEKNRLQEELLAIEKKKRESTLGFEDKWKKLDEEYKRKL